MKPISKQALYSMVSSKARETTLRLFELTKSSNDNVALGACKVLLNKVLPDLRAQEVSFDDLNKSILVQITGDKSLLEFNESKGSNSL
jgi:hypothetical protein